VFAENCRFFLEKTAQPRNQITFVSRTIESVGHEPNKTSKNVSGVYKIFNEEKEKWQPT